MSDLERFIGDLVFIVAQLAVFACGLIAWPGALADAPIDAIETSSRSSPASSPIGSSHTLPDR